jgi:DNA-binding response OmpR family regulator
MKNVLLVEDDKFLSTLLKNRLEKEGLTVNHVSDGESAITALQETIPDLTLMDIILPKKNGFEVLEEIRQDPRMKGLPIIIISNLGQASDIAKSRELGAIEYYVKAQTSIDDLVVKIKNFLKAV